MKSFAAAGAGAATMGAFGYNYWNQQQDPMIGLTLDATDYAYFAYVSEYGKSYATVPEFIFRSAQFRETKEFVDAHNADPTQTHEVEINKFADQTYEELKKMNGYIPRTEEELANVVYVELPEAQADSVDWRSKGKVSEVKDQKQCGSCWAFSTTGSTESANAIKHGRLSSFSEQQLVDCDTSTNHGCHGGNMEHAFQYIETHPLMLEHDYPYTAKDGTCKYVKSKGEGKVSGYHDVPRHNAGSLRSAIAIGPVSIAVEADKRVFQQYKTGILKGAACGTKLDHGVLAVGYGSESGENFAIVKNSWGGTWGDKGYLKISTDDNTCGILADPSYPVAG